MKGNQNFNVSNNLIFNSKDARKFYIYFINYGKVLNNEKQCEFYIRVCHKGCSDCYDSDVDENNRQCKKCKDGYYLIKDTRNCMAKEEMINTNYSFNKEEKIFKICDNYFYYNTLDNNLKYCTSELSCPKDFNKLIEDKKQCIDDCSLDNEYKYEFRKLCYKECPSGISEISKIKSFYCEAIWNKEYTYEIIETQEYVSKCSKNES